MTRMVVCGVAGRMGVRLSNLILESDDLELAGGTETPGHSAIGADIGETVGAGNLGISVSDNLEEITSQADVVTNFTAPRATVEAAEICGRTGVAMVVGTTGLDESQLSQFKRAVSDIPCAFAPNFSVGVNLLFKLVKEASQILGDAYDVEIIETHHNLKKDAPSGTAVKLAQIVAEALKRDLSDSAVYGREGMTGERTEQEIGIHAVRAGDIVGEHSVLFGGIGESIQLVHRAQSRDSFATGALRAVRFVARAEPGLYDMTDVLGIK